MSNFSKKGGTRPPSPREVNSRGPSPAVGRLAPSGALSCLPRIIEMILLHDIAHAGTVRVPSRSKFALLWHKNVTSQKDGKKKSRSGFQPLENHAARCRVYLLPRIIEKLQ